MLLAAGSFPEVELVKAVPGIDPLNACRFSNVRKLWRYCWCASVASRRLSRRHGIDTVKVP
jgi:hypothetical protein